MRRPDWSRGSCRGLRSGRRGRSDRGELSDRGCRSDRGRGSDRGGGSGRQFRLGSWLFCRVSLVVILQ